MRKEDVQVPVLDKLVADKTRERIAKYHALVAPRFNMYPLNEEHGTTLKQAKINLDASKAAVKQYTALRKMLTRIVADLKKAKKKVKKAKKGTA